MDWIRLDTNSVTQAHLAQMMQMEQQCGLEPYTQEMIDTCVSQMYTFALTEKEEIRGFITLQTTQRYSGGGIYIVNLNVANDYRRQGIGRALVLGGCSYFLKNFHQSYVFLDVARDNLPAMKLYESLGFSDTGEKSWNGPTDIVMAAPLDSLLEISKSDRVELRLMTPADVYDGIQILMDQKVNRTYMIPDLTADSAKTLFFRLCNLGCGKRYVRGVYLDNLLIGFLNEVESSGSRIELGWVINPRFHNRGFATEAVRTAIQDLFFDGYRVVEAGAFPQNLASIRVMEKSGMKRIGKTEEIEYRGNTYNCVFYEIDRGAE